MTMTPHASFASSTFRGVARRLVELHELIKNGLDDSPEAESVRDALDMPLRALNRSEKERAQWLSEDLYSISEPTASPQKSMNPQAQQRLNEAFEARQSRDWDRALTLLRRWKEYISPGLLSYLRGAVWLEAGVPEVAVVFYAHASDQDPENGNYRAIYLHTLAKTDPSAASSAARDVLAEAERWPPVVVAHAADIRFGEAKNLKASEAAQLCRELIPILGKNVTRIEKDEEAIGSTSAYAMTLALLGFAHEFLDEARAAIGYYTRALNENPTNEGLLVARGILLYGSELTAIKDLERAVQAGSRLVWPYLLLAHHYLLTRRFEECREMCVAGLKMDGSDTANSQLEEWRAIAQAELGFPHGSVRAAFESALRYDPSNELAKRNLAAFEASLQKHVPKPGSRWEHKSEADVRQFGLSERRYTLAA